ncbi:MAG: ABC transporter ATP-binding protein [Bacteroidales bacterium]|jgi:lipopolysaccharide transport system ATP-binding protein|nr:ABC transporter ATP-binding protein [Bacteroidales bacterium]MDD4213375.1 ABC transporter ATP-binding protein [Bacteroidales bacterium]
MEDYAVRVTGLSKKYSLSKNQIGIPFKDRINLLFNKNNYSKNNNDEFYALKDINFEIKRGEAVGIIGLNGAGKSTLLKILSRITEPTTGLIEINGTVASVLEVGMGFHPDLTGRENVFLNGSMMRIPKKEIEKNFNEIVDFAGVKKFIDVPIKHYSSGMYVRLAFSVVAHVDADILLFDEVLAVGDIAFQFKCAQKIKQIINQKKTMLIVSHNMNDIQHLCSSVICLDDGEMFAHDNTSVIHKYYENSLAKSDKKNNVAKKIEFKNIYEKEWKEYKDKGPGNNEFRVIKIYAVNEKTNNNEIFCSDDSIGIVVDFELFVDNPVFDFCIYLSSFGFYFLSSIYSLAPKSENKYLKAGIYKTKLIFKENFFNESIINIGFSVSGDDNKVIWSDSDVLTIKINLNERKKIYLDGFHQNVSPLMPDQEWLTYSINTEKKETKLNERE